MKVIIQNTLEILEKNKREINAAQKQMLKDQYNLYTGGFYYAFHEIGGMIIECETSTFRNLEYYLGFEYEEENQEIIIKANNKVIVSYFGGERVDRLIEQLKELEDLTCDRKEG